MGKRMLGCLVLAICMLGLGGCMFGNVDEMYALPKSSEAYVNLQAKINQEKGSAEYIAPLSGENRQTIQLVDVDGDGVQEAVAFFRDTTSENPLKIVIFKQDEHEEYQVYTRIEGVGSEIESIDYLDLGGSGGMDILVSWQVSGRCTPWWVTPWRKNSLWRSCAADTASTWQRTWMATARRKSSWPRRRAAAKPSCELSTTMAGTGSWN